MPRTAPPPSSALAELARDDSSRKHFLRMMGGGGAAAGLAVLLAACGDDEEAQTATTKTASGQGTPSGASATSGGGDIAIVNYALTLEFIEADYYAQAVASGLVKDKQALELAKKFGEVEQEHVEALTATVKGLGGKPVKAPETAFEPVLQGGEEMILQIAATVENLGASAYLGQAGRIESKEVLAAALSIHSVEARHAAALNQLVGRQFKGGSSLEGSVPDGAFAKPMTMQEVLDQARPFLAN